MHDEGRDHRGRNAIQQWKREADTKFQYVLEPLDASVARDTVRVRARLTGDLPGSPIELDHCGWRIPKESATSRDCSPCPELCEYAVARPQSGLSGADSHLQLHWNPFSAPPLPVQIVRAAVRSCARNHACGGSLVNRRCRAMKYGKTTMISRGGSTIRTPAIAALIFANLRGTVGKAQRSHPWSNVCDA
jgi:hypothetical protein